MSWNNWARNSLKANKNNEIYKELQKYKISYVNFVLILLC